MRLLTPADYRVMPWKNGGGTTTELHVALADDPVAPFLWRVSIATVVADGPFSRFEGYDRHIMCIEGSGMVLHGGPAGPIAVTEPDRPVQFSGEWPIASHLVAGPIRDFNLIAWRAALTSRLEGRRLEAPEDVTCDDAEAVLVHLLAGALAADGGRCPDQTSLLLAPGDRVRLTPEDEADAPRLAVCRVTRRP